MQVTTTARNASLDELVDMLRRQRDVRYDVVVPASTLRSLNGRVLVEGGAAQITDEGVESTNAILNPTDVFDDGVSIRLNIPRDYLRRLRGRADNGALVDANVNGWLDVEPERRFLVRGFRTDDPNEVGVARALLSDKFKPVDNLDVLFATLDGVRRAGVNVEVQGTDLSERKMRLRLVAPEITAAAPVWLGNYRSPFEGSGHGGSSAANPLIVSAGLELRNSETGGSAFVLVPRIVVQICDNGATITKDALRQVHLGSRLDEGVIRWSEETQRHNLELVTSQARDAVASFLDADYVAAKVAEIEEQSGKPLPIGEAIPTIERISSQLRFTQTEQDSILDAFTRSGDMTAGGVMQAVTATAQLVEDPDRAADLEDAALQVLDLAAA